MAKRSVFTEWEMRCPACKSDTHMVVSFEGSAKITIDGTEDDGDHEWGDDSAIRCEACDRAGTVYDFKPDNDHTPRGKAMTAFERDATISASFDLLEAAANDDDADLVDIVRNFRDAWPYVAKCLKPLLEKD